MNSEPYEPFEPFDPFDLLDPADRSPACGSAETRGCAGFFDGAGLAWITLCVAVAASAGYWIPRVSEPGSMAAVMVALGWADAPQPAPSRALGQQGGAAAPAQGQTGTDKPAKPLAKLPLGML